jgi:hypothetical protein
MHVKKKIFRILIIFIFTFGLLSCKKGTKPSPPISLTGKWTVNRYILAEFKNGVAYPIQVSTTFDNAFYQFNNDGTGADSNGDPGIGPFPFNYYVTNLDLTFSTTTYYMHASSCTITKPDDNHLVIQGSHSYQSAGDTYKVNEEVDLSK